MSASNSNPASVVTSATTELRPIELELVQGTKEEVYWAKVPEKVRRMAKEKTRREEDGIGPGLGGDEPGKGNGAKRGKKRKLGK
jgi:hypothetical protein